MLHIHGQIDYQIGFTKGLYIVNGKSREKFEDILITYAKEHGVVSSSSKELGGTYLSIPNCVVRIFYSDKEVSLAEAEEGFIRQLYGGTYAEALNYGYSEWTILGCDLEKLTVGGHDILREIRSHDQKYIHFCLEENQKINYDNC